MDLTTRGLGRGLFFSALSFWILSTPVAAAIRIALPPTAIDPGIAQAAILATNSVHVKSTVTITGNVVANTASPGPTLVPGFEVFIDKPATINGDVLGDSISLAKQVTISGGVTYNQLSNSGASTGGLHTPLALPVFGSLPAFQESIARPGAANVFVGPGQTVTLVAGEYGNVEVAQFGTLVLAGGLYDAVSWTAVSTSGVTCNFPCRTFRFAAPATVRIGGRLDVGKADYFGPASGSGVSAAQILIYVGGVNGGTGVPTATPPAAWVGRGSVVGANLYAPGGTVQVDRDCTVSGALFGRDVRIDSNSSLVRASAFANLPPVAQPATGFTSGAASLTLELTAFDPEGEDLTFSIVIDPTHGSLGPVSQAPPPFPGNPPGCNPDNVPGCIPPDPPRTSATVVYTPFASGDLEDSFVFAASDPHGASGSATVRINPPEAAPPPPPPLDSVRALDGLVETAVELPVVVHLLADAPEGVELSFAIVAGSGPNHGTLGTVEQGEESPRRSATVVYTPANGFAGADGFAFEACDVTATLACDQAAVSIAVSGELAEDQEVTTPENVEVTVFLSGIAGAGGSVVQSITGKAAVLVGAAIAGNVADANSDGFGDNHNALPGGAPVFMSAGLGLSGGAGSNGTVRMQIEWDLSSISVSASSLESAAVTLSTNKGSVDSLDTFFFAGTGEGNGTLDDADFQEPVVAISGAVMPVPDVPTGTDGTFTFDVTGALRSLLASDHHSFVVQGRVDEVPANLGERGLQVRTTAGGNLVDNSEPKLSIATPGVSPPPLQFRIVSLPTLGTLRDSQGAIIGTVPLDLADRIVRYTPSATPSDVDDTFDFEVEDFFFNRTARATVTIHVLAVVDPCTLDGRDPGCQP